MTRGVLHLSLANDLGELERLGVELERFLEPFDVGMSFQFELNLILEELVTNIIKYGLVADEEDVIDLRVSLERDRAEVVVEDEGVAFDPTKAKTPNIECALDDRKIGGLGIHLVRNLVSDMRYERKGTKNILTFSKSTSSKCS